MIIRKLLRGLRGWHQCLLIRAGSMLGVHIGVYVGICVGGPYRGSIYSLADTCMVACKLLWGLRWAALVFVPLIETNVHCL